MGKLRKCIKRFTRPVGLVFCLALISSISCSSGEDVFAPWQSVVSSPGARAGDFLSAAGYTTLVVEIQPFAGMQPTQQAMDNLTQFLQARLNKPGGVQVVVDAELPTSGQASFSIGQIRQIEAQSRTMYPNGQTMVAYFLMLDGDSDQSNGNMRILGHAYGATSMAIYQAAIQDLSGGIGEPARDVLESTVINHEFGHILGLVGNGSPPVQPGHHDTANGAHCTNQNCLMYYAVDISDVVANLLGGSIPALDADCIDDLRNNGGK